MKSKSYLIFCYTVIFLTLFTSLSHATPDSASIKVNGMVCISCEKAIQATVKKQIGILSVVADHSTGFVRVEFEPEKTTLENIIHAIEGLNFHVER